MILEFKDGTQITIKGAFGGPRLVQGVMRDTLRFEIDPTMTEFDKLKTYFKDRKRTDRLYLYNDPKNVNGTDVTKKSLAGDGYNIFVSITDEERLVATPPGVLVQPQIEEVYTVTIAQETYDEHQAQEGN